MPKITDYTAKTVFDDGDLYDCSTYDGVSAYATEKVTWLQLKTELSSALTVNSIYTANDSLTSARTVTLSGTNTLTFTGGLTTFVGQDATNSNYAAKFQDSALNDLLFVRNDGLISASGIINSDTNYNQNNLWLIGRRSSGLAVGNNALLLSAGTLSVAVGDAALRSTGIRSTAIGYNAGFPSTGTYNFFGGFSSAPSISTGNYNVGLGAQCMTNISSGSNNTFLGALSGAISSSSISSSVAIGYQSRVNRSNQFVMGSNGNTIADMHLGAGIYSQNGSYNGYSEFNMWLTNIEDGNTDISSSFDWVWNGSAGTGTGTGGDHIWKVAPPSTTGSTQNTQVEVMRIKNDGNINMSNLPTSSAGLATGDLWNNSGVLTIA